MPNGLAGLWPLLKKKLDEVCPAEREPAVRIYGDIAVVWHRFHDYIRYPHFSPPSEQVKSDLCRGKHLLCGNPLPLDRRLFHEVLLRITSEAVKYFPQAGHILDALKQIDGEKVKPDSFYDQVACLDRKRLQQYLLTEPLPDPTLGGHLIFMAAVPFYVEFAAAIEKQVDLSLWGKGYCPVCGQLPVMAKLSAEDGARILECELCHHQWPFPRLECPFCGNRDFQQQQYFYIDEIPGRRVQLCECCKSYLKTAVIKEIGREVILDIDNILTWRLDGLARKEGYRLGEELVLLNLDRRGGY